MFEIEIRPSHPRREISRQKLITFLLILVLLLSLAEIWHTWHALPEHYALVRQWLLANTGMSRSMIFAVAVSGMLLLTWAYSHIAAALIVGKKWFRLFLVAAATLIPGAYLFDKLNEQVCFNRAAAPLCDLVLTDEHTYRQWRKDAAVAPLGWKVIGTLTEENKSLIGPAPQELPIMRCMSIQFFPGGVPAVYLSRRRDGFHLWNHDGFDPFTMQRLEPVQQTQLSRICAQLDVKADKLERDNAAKAERARQLAQERAAAQEAAEQAERAQRERSRLDRRNAPDLSAARLAASSGNLLRAKPHIDAVLARDPGNQEAAQLASEWQLAKTCAACGRVIAIGETTVRQARSNYPSLLGGVGAAAARSRSSAANRYRNTETGALVGTALGTLVDIANANKLIFIISVRMDDGRIEHVPSSRRPPFAAGDRVVRTALGREIQLSLQGGGR